MKIIICDQYDETWWRVRRGVPTASCADKVLTSQGKPSKQQDKYIFDLIADSCDASPDVSIGYQSAAMARGLEMEPEARKYYEFARGVTVTEVGFCITDDGRFGCSPDGLVESCGGVEIKCPSKSTQIDYLLADRVPTKYIPQVHWSMAVTGRSWWDFLSYSDGLPKLLIRVVASDYTKKMKNEMFAFWNVYQTRLKEIQELQ